MKKDILLRIHSSQFGRKTAELTIDGAYVRYAFNAGVAE